RSRVDHPGPRPMYTFLWKGCESLANLPGYVYARRCLALTKGTSVISHPLRTYRSEEELPREEQLAYKLASLAADRVPVDDAATDLTVDRIIGNAAGAMASGRREPVVAARAQALDHPYSPGSSVFGVADKVSPEWAAWANGVAVRELDYHDTYLAAHYSHHGDNIPPLLAVAEHLPRTGPHLNAG